MLLEHAHVRVERVVLEHHRDVAVLGLQVVLTTRSPMTISPRGDRLQARHHAQQRRLAAARRADDDDELAVGDRRSSRRGSPRARRSSCARRAAGLWPCSRRHFSVSTRPLTNHRCISITTSAGGSIASIAVAMTRFHSVARVAADDHPLDADHRRVHRLPAVVDQQRPQVLVPAVDEQDHEQRGDVGAATAARTTSQKKRIGPAPSMRAASASSSGIVRKNCRNRNVAVAEAISGSVRPGVGVEHAQVGDDLVGRQDAHLDRQHQRDEDHPEEELAQRKAEVDDRERRRCSEIAILPIAITSAMIRLLTIIATDAAPSSPAVQPRAQHRDVVLEQVRAGRSAASAPQHLLERQRRGDEGHVERKRARRRRRGSAPCALNEREPAGGSRPCVSASVLDLLLDVPELDRPSAR